MTLTEQFKTPGQYIQSLLDQRDWNQTILSIVLEVSQTSISEIINGKRRVDAQLALGLAEVFDVPAENFMELQQAYDLASARVVAKPNPGRNTRALLFNGLPISDMIKRGWMRVSDVRNMPAVESALTKFFEVPSVSDIEILPHAAKRTEVSGEATPVQLAWLYRVKKIAGEMVVGRYSPEAVRSALPKLSALLLSREEARKVPRILAECGIRFVLVESLPSAKIDGVCFWLDEKSPVIGMTLRHDRIDNFWFVLRHEIEHVLQLHGQRSGAMLDAELEGARAGVGSDVSEEERVANAAASEFCVPAKLLKGFLVRKAPYFYEPDLLAFAAMLKVHPGLVAGQIRHATTRYELFTHHLVKIRSVIAPNAVIDGWGTVAPIEI